MRERNGWAWLAWHTANMVRAKKMPKLDAIIVKTSTPKARRQTWQQQMAIMDQWTAVMEALTERGKT